MATLRPISNVMVLGAGTMGAGIAQVCAANKFKVTLVDTQKPVLEKSLAKIEKSMTKLLSKKIENAEELQHHVKTNMANITITTKNEEGAEQADLIIEAIIENLDVKKSVWGALDKVAPEKTLFASNTSSLSIKEIAEATGRPQNFGGLHFFSPVPLMRLVEVVKADLTSADTETTLFEFCKQIKKSPIRCKDTPGFVVNRLLVPLIMEAIRMVERGDASIEDIDTAMKLGCGHPMGPLELSDAVGNDVTKMIIDGWHQKFPEETLFNPSPLLNKMIEENKLGVKAGKGFYSHDPNQLYGRKKNA
eukprot:Sspe_Gene.59666::Locus_32783_Transcript_1_1_Confidence_1.000_Length_1127::g.59666::m.59666/K00022/HADH; 3-hydroxyacyl-CoA dehydrogenase